MARRNAQPRDPSARKPVASMPIVNPNAAAIDVHSDNHVVCVPADRDPQDVRTFGANSCDLLRIAAWLKECGITTVAIESTGIYWVPLFELLEARGLEVCLIEPGQASRCGARPKTDVLDAQWLQRLHSHGLLRGSFRPPDLVIALRAYLRQRQMLISYASTHIQHMQKALEQMNLKLTEVVSEITGLTGMLIIRAILDGQRDPATLAAFRQAGCKNDEATIARALEGTWRDEHLFELAQAYELYQTYQMKVTQCDERIEEAVGKLPDRSAGAKLERKPPTGGRKPNNLRFDGTKPLFRAFGVDLTAIEGIEAPTALVILGEIGVDVSKFPTEKHFTSWLGLCPNHQRSNQKLKSRRVRKGKNRAAIALRLAARSLRRSHSALGAYFRRMNSRLGLKGAITATAHKLARIIYNLMRYGAAYMRREEAAYAEQVRERQERQLLRRAKELGFEVKRIAPPGVEPSPGVEVPSTSA
jgi:transposase